MSYGADFAQADPANAPLDPMILIGAEPTFWAAILLVIAAALFLGWYLGTRWNPHRANAAHAIWHAIHDAAQSAMRADDNALKGQAEALRRVIDERLGKTLKLAGGLAGRIKNLDLAIAGRGPIHAGSSYSQPAQAGGGTGRSPVAHDSEQGGNGGGGGGAAAAATSVTVVTIGGQGSPTQQTPPTPPPTTPTERDLSHREQTDALRLAVAAFNQHWRDETARVSELRAAHAELSDPGSAHGSSVHGKASHGAH